jgi:hypothetical protein
MKKVLLFTVCLAYTLTVFAQKDHSARLAELNKVIEQKDVFDAAKARRIKVLQAQLDGLKTTDLIKKYNTCLNLYNEYKTFNYEKSFEYALKLQQLGQQLGDSSKVSYGKVKLGFILLSSGMFKETFELLKTVNVALLPDTAKTEYYFLNARTFYDWPIMITISTIQPPIIPRQFVYRFGLDALQGRFIPVPVL